MTLGRLIERVMEKEQSQPEMSELARRCLQGLGTGSHHQDINDIINEKGDRPDADCTWVMLTKSWGEWWLTYNPSILWVSGGPGQGKTRVTSFLAEFISRITTGAKNRTFIYFSCNYRNNNQHSALAILRSLVLQLLKQRPVLFQHILPKFDSAGEKLLGNEYALWHIFETMISSHGGDIYCMVSRLNECSPASQRLLVKMLKDTALFERNPKGGILKLIITSTETKDLKDLSEHQFLNNRSCLQRLDLNSPDKGERWLKFFP